MSNTISTIESIRNTLTSRNGRSAWDRGVRTYAIELLDILAENIKYNPDALDNKRMLHRTLLNGASNWREYSKGGCSLIRDAEIAFRLCNATELKRVKYGQCQPNAFETWLDTQARALYQAELLIMQLAHL